MNITKIDKVVTTTTEQKESAAWAEVLSHRNKLLVNTDWCLLPDAGLTPDCITALLSWRASLKAITRSNYSDRASAEKHIAILVRRIPRLTYIKQQVPEAEWFSHVEDYRRKVMRYVDNVFNNAVSARFTDNHILVDEQYREALDYLSGSPQTEYPLLSVTAELYGQTLQQIANEAVERKVISIKRMANLKQKYHYYEKLVSEAKDDVELQSIQADITLWISTST